MEIANLSRDVTPEQMKSPEFLDMLTDAFVETLGDARTQVYSKEGLLPDEVVNAAFDRMQERSLEGQLAVYGSQPIRVFTFHMDEPIVRSIEGDEFYRTFLGKFTDFVEQVPEYAKADHVKQVLEKLRGDNFSQVYGKSKFDFEGDKVVHHELLFRSYHNFASNLKDFLAANFANPQYGKDEKLPEGFPSLVPVFNFQWPETLNREDAEKAVEALRLYAGKRRYRYDHSKQRIVLDEHGELTPYEIEMADKNGQMFGFVSRQLIVAGQGELMQIIAAPMYSLKAVPRNMDGESWIRGAFANDVMRDGFRYHGFQRI